MSDKVFPFYVFAIGTEDIEGFDSFDEAEQFALDYGPYGLIYVFETKMYLNSDSEVFKFTTSP